MKKLVALYLLFCFSLAAHALTREATPESTSSLEVRAQGGELNIIDRPLVFPSPFSSLHHKGLTIQYTLSEAADIDLVIFSASGEIIKRLSFASGEEGGKANLNKVKWDGRRELGIPLANGIYIGLLISRQLKKPLANFKITAYN